MFKYIIMQTRIIILSLLSIIVINSLTCSMCGTRDCCKSDICSIHCRQMGRNGGYCEYSSLENRCICYCYRTISLLKRDILENSELYKHNETECNKNECFHDNICYKHGEKIISNDTIINCEVSKKREKGIDCCTKFCDVGKNKPYDSCSTCCEYSRANCYCSGRAICKCG